MLVISQDKRMLFEFKKAKIYGDESLAQIECDGEIVATYSSIDKATRVLEKLQRQYIKSKVENWNEACLYFQMPKDWEVVG